MDLFLTWSTKIFIALQVASIIINAVGIFVLVKMRAGCTNQSLILKNLSACHIFLAISRISYRLLEFHKIPIECSSKLVSLIGIYISLSIYYFVVISLSIDRFIACKYPLRYPMMLSRTKMKILLTASWGFCITVHLPQLFLSPQTTIEIFNFGTLPLLDLLFIITAVIGYGYIFYKISSKKSTTVLTARNNTSRPHNRNRKFIKMAAIINLRFFLLIIIPDIVFAIYFTLNFGSSSVLRTVLIYFWYLNPILDPITYVLMPQRNQASIQRAFRRRKGGSIATESHREMSTVSAVRLGNEATYDTKL